MANVFFDISFGGAAPSRIVFKLYDDVVPKTAKNFRELALAGIQILHIIQNKVKDIRDLHSIELSLTSWLKVVISQNKMVQEEDQFMEKSFLYCIFITLG